MFKWLANQFYLYLEFKIVEKINRITRCAVNHLLWLHVLIPPTPFSAVAKKGVKALFFNKFPLFALAERGTQGGEYMWLKEENKGADSWKLYWDKQLNFKYIKISTAQDVIILYKCISLPGGNIFGQDRIRKYDVSQIKVRHLFFDLQHLPDIL